MNRNKIVEMYCPNCGVIVGNQLTIILQRDGGSHMEERKPKRCPSCNTGLERHVTRIPKKASLIEKKEA